MININKLIDKYPLSHSKVKIGKTIVQIKNFLSVDEFSEAVNMVIDGCFPNDKYVPEFKDVATRYMILTTFTDIDLGDMPIEEVFKVSQADWYNIIENKVAELPIYHEIINAVNDGLEYKIRTQKNSFDYLCDTLSDFAFRMGDTSVFEKLATRLEGLDDKKVAEAIIEKE